MSRVLDRVAGAGGRGVAVPDLPLVAAATLGVAALVETVFRGGEDSTQLLFAVGTTMPLALARSQPAVAATAMAATTLLTLVSGRQPTVAALVAEVTIFYVLGLRQSRRLLGLLALPYIGYVVSPSTHGQGRKLAGIAVVALLLAAAAVGLTQRARRLAAERDASQRAIADTLLEHVARGERARIARELHDVVAHHISMIVVQAETARLATPGMPPEGAKRLVGIGDTARAALTEMRRLLGVLREDAGTEQTRRPQPGLEELNELIDEARDAAGASTRLIVRGRVVPLGPGVELTAYRIVQEALTNARRHAVGAAVDVELDFADDAVRVRVRDNGPGPPDEAVANGHGLVGMRERALMVGGTLRVGPAPGCGLLIEAILPAGGAR